MPKPWPGTHQGFVYEMKRSEEPVGYVVLGCADINDRNNRPAPRALQQPSRTTPAAAQARSGATPPLAGAGVQPSSAMGLEDDAATPPTSPPRPRKRAKRASVAVLRAKMARLHEELAQEREKKERLKARVERLRVERDTATAQQPRARQQLRKAIKVVLREARLRVCKSLKPGRHTYSHTHIRTYAHSHTCDRCTQTDKSRSCAPN